MGGIDVGGGGGKGRRPVDSEINMIPFIDLLMVTISFLLITAVWSHMASLEANTQVPGNPDKPPDETPPVPEKQLHVEMRDPDKFVLAWKEGATVISSFDVPRKDNLIVTKDLKEIRFPELAQKIESEWRSTGLHRDATDKKFDTAVLHTDNETTYVYIVGVIDAIYQAHRPVQRDGKTEQVPAFNVTFSTN
jgi:biopolymer transport protein ExbD